MLKKKQLTDSFCSAAAKSRAIFLFALLAFSWNTLAGEKLVSIANKKGGGVTTFTVQNLQSAEVTVTIEAKLSNYTPNKPLPVTLTVPPKSKVEAFTLSPAKPDGDSTWSYTYFATWGNLTANHDDTVVYALPYAPGEAYPVSQGFHGSYSHTGGDAFAIDFKMDEGTHVHAARPGVVVGSRDDSSNGGPSKKYEWDANYILIQHNDGTLGHYVHLQKGGNRVKVGDLVKVGDWIGKSGNTGHTTGPHLHFAVFKAANGKSRQTFPIRFNGEGLVAQTLKEGASYRAAN
jgi:murein DD-endopeptidase MepM/ murein hydrolase activator NlpD